MLPQTLGVIGLGPVGGSVAWGAVRHGVPRVIGWSASTRDGAAAVRAGAITEFAHDAAAVCGLAEVVVFATPPEETAQLLGEHADVLVRRGVVCTDTAGVKCPIVATAQRLGLGGVFAGSHPLVDDVAVGFLAAHPDRMRGALVYVTPVTDGHGAADEVRDFWKRSVGAHPVVLSPERHDELVAWTEHLPRAVTSILASVLASNAPRGVSVPPTVLEATRIADADSYRWSTVLHANQERLGSALEAFAAELAGVRTALEDGDLERLRLSLEAAAAWRRKQRP